MERSELIRGLREVDPTKPYGTELFDALAHLTVSVAVEAVCLRLNSTTKRVEVYMVRRSPDDTAYPGEWHCPGSVLRPKEDIRDVFARLETKEFGGPLNHWQFVANVNHPTEARGHFFSLVYLCGLRILDNAGDCIDLKGEWFFVDQLPEKTVESHRIRIIPAAVGAFVAENTRICV